MEKCNVIFPGAFKPVHSGHVLLIDKYLHSKDYEVLMTILISKQLREGISAESSKWFLEQVFAKRKNVKIRISTNPSPINAVYDMTGQKEFGEGTYAMGRSSKEKDEKKVNEYVKQFAKDGKYYTKGVKVISFPIDPEPITYSKTSRKDLYANAAISSTIVRQDVRNNDFENFKTAYEPLINSKEYPNVTEELVKEYFEKLKKEVLPIKTKHMNSSLTEHYLPRTDTYFMLNEGGNAGHTDHPYEVEEFTFAKLSDLVIDLFAGRVHNITEKLDGQNLFASVDDNGETIFSRNDTTLYEVPWKLDDIQHNPKWEGTPSVQHAFSNAAVTIDKVFKNIPKAAALFNYDDKADGVRYRTWVNLEIIDTENFNVIPYVESKISFHNLKTTVFDYSDKESFTKDDQELRNPRWEMIDLPENEYNKIWNELQKAIAKTNRVAFKVQVTPEVVLKKVEEGNKKAEPYNNKLKEIAASAGLDTSATILEYKKKMLTDYIEKSGRLKWITGDLKSILLDRWVGKNTQKISEIKKSYTLETGKLMTKNQYDLLRDFEKNDLSLVIKKIMKPLDTLFIKLGNEIIKRVQGLENAGHEQEVIKKISKDVKKIKDAIENSKDQSKIAKLQYSLQRLAAVNNEYNATEGIVFSWGGHVMKLTGAFAPINQIIGEKNKR